MIFYSGWINLGLSYDSDDFTEADEEQMIKSIELLISPLKKYNSLCEIKKLSWSNVFYIGSEFNHNVGYKDEIIELFREIGKIARGSYGILYLRDLEDKLLSNEFQIYRLAKGIVTEHKDLFLSPCDPIIENEVE